MKNNYQKGFVVPLVIAIVFLVLGGSYLYYKTQNNKAKSNLPTDLANTIIVATSSDQTSGWKTYTNSQYGFQVNYPSDWTVAVGTHYGGGIQDKGEVQFAIVKQNNPTSIEDLQAITFTVKPAKYASNDQLLVAKQDEISSNPHIKNIWNVTQSNFLNMGKAVLVSEDETKVTTPVGCVPTGTLSENVFIVKTPNIFTFNDYRCFGDQIQQIMNTFKFIPTSVTSQDVSSNLIKSCANGATNPPHCNADLPMPLPVITSISPSSGPIGTIIELKGTNLAGFEGDLDAIIENSKAETAFLPGIGSAPRTDQTIRVKIEGQLCKSNNGYSGLPCTSFLTITPGTYKIYTAPWGKVSNKVEFTVAPSSSANSFVGQCSGDQIWTGTKCASKPTYDEMLNSILQAKILGMNARIKADMMNMRVIAELIYQDHNSYASFCSNGVINQNSYKDLPPIVQDIITSQEAIDQNSAGIKCISNQTGYALQITFTKIPTTGSRWFCLDWLGHQGDDTKFKIDTTALECKPI